MNHFPIFMATKGRRITLSGGGETALAKLRLLLKTEAELVVFATNPAGEITGWANAGKLTLTRRILAKGDVSGSLLFYAANEDAIEDARVAAIAKAEGALVNLVDNLNDSQFITPAIVDRDPVTVAIGTEGAAPVLARAIKADIETRLPGNLGLLARLGKAFRARADALPFGRKRRDFWSDYYFNTGPKTLETEGEAAVTPALQALLDQHLQNQNPAGHVDLVGAGPGDPELLTLKARTALDAADVVIHDRLVPGAILDLARREAIIIETGKQGFGPSVSQKTINDLIVTHARRGAQVVRLKSGDATIFGRLDEEIDALEAASISWRIVPGVTAASAAVAAIGQSLTKRGRNASVRLLTGHDMQGYAEQDWRALARTGEVAAIYMGKKAARFVQGRLLMHGAAADTDVTIIENASQPNQRIFASSLATLPQTLSQADVTGPALILYGLAPRAAQAVAKTLKKEQA